MWIYHDLVIHFRVKAFNSLPVGVTNIASFYEHFHSCVLWPNMHLCWVSVWERNWGVREVHLFSFSRCYWTVCKVAVPIYTPKANTGIFSLFHSSYSGRYVMVSQRGFNLHIPDDQWSWLPFPIVTDHLDNFFCEAEIFTFEASKLKCWCEFFQVVKFKDSVNRVVNLKQDPFSSVLWHNLGY